jgi:ATP-dependent Clp protease ATP-binding subunit ClpA
VTFKSLTPEIIREVVQKFVLQLEAQLADRNVTLELSDDAADWLAKNGFDELYGARPLARVIQEHIKKPLADEILFGKLVRGGHVKVELHDGKIAFDIEADHGPAKPEEIESLETAEPAPAKPSPRPPVPAAARRGGKRAGKETEPT